MIKRIYHWRLAMDRFKFSSYMIVFKQFIELAWFSNTQENIKFRLLEVEEESGGATIQIIGSMKSFRADVKELIRSDLLMSFSKRDAIWITYLGTKLDREEKKKKGFKYRFKKLLPALYGGKSSIEVENKQGELEQRPCSDVVDCSELVATATDTEKVHVGYIAGYESCKEKRENI